VKNSGGSSGGGFRLRRDDILNFFEGQVEVACDVADVLLRVVQRNDCPNPRPRPTDDRSAEGFVWVDNDLPRP